MPSLENLTLECYWYRCPYVQETSETHLNWAHHLPEAALAALTPLNHPSCWAWMQPDSGIPTGCSQVSTFGIGSKILFYLMTPGTSLVLINCKRNDIVSCPSTLFQPNPRAAGYIFLWNSWIQKTKRWLTTQPYTAQGLLIPRTLEESKPLTFSTLPQYFPCQVTEMTTLPDSVTKCRHYLRTPNTRCIFRFAYDT